MDGNVPVAQPMGTAHAGMCTGMHAALTLSKCPVCLPMVALGTPMSHHHACNVLMCLTMPLYLLPPHQTGALLTRWSFHQCLLACAFEVVAASYRMGLLSFPAIPAKLGLKPFDLSKMIGPFVKAEPTLPRSVSSMPCGLCLVDVSGCSEPGVDHTLFTVHRLSAAVAA